MYNFSPHAIIQVYRSRFSNFESDGKSTNRKSLASILTSRPTQHDRLSLFQSESLQSASVAKTVQRKLDYVKNIVR
jgi:hypothetical protein